MTACDMQDNEIAPETSFTAIYNNEQFTEAYHPTSIRQTADSGFIVLATTNLEDSEFRGIYILKVDAQGDFQWDRKASLDYVNPVSDLLVKANEYYFFCMDKLNLGTYLIKINTQDSTTQEVSYQAALQYPLAASATSDGGYIVQSYNREDKRTQLSKLNTNGIVSWQKDYDTHEDVEEDIVRHLIGTIRPLPFFTGSMGSTHYFNGFYNYSFSMVFVGSDGELTGVINGPGIDDAISNALPLAGNQFALSRYSYSENQLIPQQDLNANGIGVTGDIQGFSFSELNQKAKVKIQKMTVNGQRVVMYGSETKGNQIILLAYQEGTDTLLGTHYLGFSHPYQLADFTLTNDGGLAVVGNTNVDSRFPRISLFKLSPEELTELVTP